MAIVLSDGGGSSFPQQGTVDWAKLAQTSVRATVDILSRISTAHVDPFTLTVAQAVAGQFRLSVLGKERLRDCLKSLRFFAGLENALYFGVGTKHVVRILACTTQGESAIALCGGLAEVMSTEMVATILDRMPGLYKAPPELQPSLVQWEALVSSCSGVVASTNFGHVAEHFMRLSGTDLICPVPLPVRSSIPPVRSCGNPQDVAAALCAIARVSQGTLLAIELRGGAVCGVLAALGFWFLGLDVEVRKGSSVVYRSVSDQQTVHLTVLYNSDESQVDPSEVQLATRSYYIRDIQTILGQRMIDHDNENYILTGRVKWAEAIHSTFGSSAQELFKAHYHFGQVLGSAANLFEVLAHAKDFDLGITSKRVLQPIDLKSVILHNDNSHGKGLLHFMIKRFPELSTLDWRTMEECVGFPPARAQQELTAAAGRLRMACGCVLCDEPKDPGDYRRFKPFCLCLLACTILITARNLAFVHLDIQMQPYRAGLECLYRKLEFFAGSEPFQFADICRNIQMAEVYSTAEAVFTGRRVGVGSRQGVERAVSTTAPPAFTYQGMTFYLDILRELSDCPANAGILHVVPGNIVLESGRMPSVVLDAAPATWIDYNSEAYEGLSALPISADTSSPDLEATLAVEESVRELCAEFRFSRADRLLCSLGPTDLLYRLVRSSFNVDCPRLKCPKLTTPLHNVFSADGEGKVYPEADRNSGRLIVIRRLQGNPIARCLALHQCFLNAVPSKDAMVGDTDMPSCERNDALSFESMIMKGDECWSCCIKAALQRRAQPVYIL